MLIVFVSYHGYIRPNKNKLVNIQELLLLLNLTILHAVSYYDSSYVFSLVANIMISLALVQFLTIVMYHFLTYTYPGNIVDAFHTLRDNVLRCFDIRPLEDSYLNADIALLDNDENDNIYNNED